MYIHLYNLLYSYWLGMISHLNIYYLPMYFSAWFFRPGNNVLDLNMSALIINQRIIRGSAQDVHFSTCAFIWVNQECISEAFQTILININSEISHGITKSFNYSVEFLKPSLELVFKLTYSFTAIFFVVMKKIIFPLYIYKYLPFFWWIFISTVK